MRASAPDNNLHLSIGYLMDEMKFIFVEVLKATGLALGGLLAAKAIAGFGRDRARRSRFLWLRGLLYAALFMLVSYGAWTVGHDVAAEVYYSTGEKNLGWHRYPRAYSNALRAVQLRPGILRYWTLLDRCKLSTEQFESLIADERIVRSLSGGEVDELNAMEFAFAHYFLGHYDRALAIGDQVIRTNRFYGPPYVLRGMVYLAQKRYVDAEKSYLAALQMFPSDEDAVRGLAQAYFLSGDRVRAVKVLQATANFPFPDASRQSFKELERVYSQDPPVGQEPPAGGPPGPRAAPAEGAKPR